MADSISLSEFNELIMYRKPDREKSAMGQVKETWTDYRKALVKVVESGNDEINEGNRINLPGVITVSGHYDSAVKSTYRLIWNEIEYNITGITAMQNRRFMVVRAERVFE